MDVTGASAPEKMARQLRAATASCVDLARGLRRTSNEVAAKRTCGAGNAPSTLAGPRGRGTSRTRRTCASSTPAPPALAPLPPGGVASECTRQHAPNSATGVSLCRPARKVASSVLHLQPVAQLVGKQEGELSGAYRPLCGLEAEAVLRPIQILGT